VAAQFVITISFVYFTTVGSRYGAEGGK
jgi:hypothetical protein